MQRKKSIVLRINGCRVKLDYSSESDNKKVLGEVKKTIENSLGYNHKNSCNQ